MAFSILVLMRLWVSGILIGLDQLMIESPHLVLYTILDLLLLLGLARNNQQLHYLLQKLSIMLLFLLVRKLFGFDSY